jgi:hypothetical protein
LRKRVLELLGSVAEQQNHPTATFRGKMAALRALENLGDLEALPILRRVADREVDGRIVRLARTVANALRQGATKPQELVSLRGDLDSMVKENKALRDRVEAVEQRAEMQAPKKADSSPAGNTSTPRAGGGTAVRSKPAPSSRAAAAKSSRKVLTVKAQPRNAAGKAARKKARR